MFEPEVSIRTSMADYKEQDALINLPLYAIEGRRGKSCVNSIKTSLLGENYGRNNFYQGGFST